MYNFLKEESTIDTRKECIRASTFDSVDAEATYASIFFPRVYKEPGSMKGDDSLFEDKINIPVVENAFTVAAFLAVDALASAKPSHNIDFKYDLGVDTLVPVMSPVAMAFISAQLCLFLGSLLAMALYSALKPRWTLQLDAFAMMRIGAQAAERFPLLVTRKVQKYSILDETPGWIGGAMPAHDEKHKASQLELGALVVPLRGREFYHCYPADDERELRRMKRERNASRWYQPFW
ncbi:hypothetical protein CDD82_1578 [Ophiocordyceps australis]|uniref:Uncharacterized protein n=1 Tax=Ophiocordyceps australis TaxID=1399860 RepID=A0A2C5XL18_9HYPO|nr:hypothetical protein CDD82_1578 [Ophiocordyceps australis]